MLINRLTALKIISFPARPPQPLSLRILDTLPEGVLVLDAEWRVRHLNPVAEGLLEISSDLALGQALDQVVTLQDGISHEAVSLCAPQTPSKSFPGVFDLLLRKDGTSHPIEHSVAQISTDDGGYIVLLRDARKLQQHIDHLTYRTSHDEQTRLLRRGELIRRLSRILQDSKPDDPNAFLYMDLDHFKAINDTAGHAAGDTAICEIAARMQSTIRGRDTLARMGGDEFGLLLERCPSQHARERAEQLHHVVSSYALHWQGSEFRLGVSIGLVILNSNRHSLNTVLTTADAACYLAKRSSDTGPHIQEVALE